MISIVAALGRNREIGRGNALLWRLPSDLRNFRRITGGGTVVMGRKTYESIGRPLPDRRNIVVTRTPGFAPEGVEAASSFAEAMEICQWDCFVIGGSQVYEQAIGLAQRMYLTHVDGEFEADAFFPEYGEEWVRVSEVAFTADGKDEYDHVFVRYDRCEF